MFESKSGILLIGGLGFFLFAFLSNALVPILLYSDMPEQSAADLAKQNANALYQWEDLSVRYPEAFKKHFGKADEKSLAKALLLARDVYVGEGCWHCHSQFVRPVSNESTRWGPVSRSEEYQNELQRPVLWGTRRVGPDLSREGGRRGNDWHAVHFFDPPAVSTRSPMPKYPWFFEGLSAPAAVRRLDVLAVEDPAAGELAAEIRSEFGTTNEELAKNVAKVWAAIAKKYPALAKERELSADAPNERGLAMIAYVQWLGSWLEDYPLYESYRPLEEQIANPLE
ncbi:MAG: cbb3-type cytochrome c oxidase subunit II [Pirellulales bacterium]|nr:cbb3-type cytochrome c oxidase subunit II [Pirellulales bacterium]